MFSFRESPQYLLARGKDAKALKVIQQILTTNKSKLQPLFTQADFREAAKRIAAHQGCEYIPLEEEDEANEGLYAGGKKRSGWESAKR